MPQMEGALAVSWVVGLPWGTTGERMAVDPRLGRSATSQPSLTACAPKLQGFRAITRRGGCPVAESRGQCVVRQVMAADSAVSSRRT